MIKIHSLDGSAANGPITFSVPWARKQFEPADLVEYSLDQTNFTQLDTLILAYWEDGSVKWTSHSLSGIGGVGSFHVRRKKLASQNNNNNNNNNRVRIAEDAAKLRVTNSCGVTTVFNKSGDAFIDSILLNDQEISSFGRIVGSSSLSTSFKSTINSTSVENKTDDRVVVLTTGELSSQRDSQSFIGFKIRTYVYAGTESSKFNVSIIYNLAPSEQLTSLGLEFSAKLDKTPLYDRHIKLTGSNGGIMSESCQSITGLWHAANPEIRTKQARGEILPDLKDHEEWGWNTDLLKYVPSFDEFSVSQLTSNGFEISKRFRKNFNKVKINGGSKNDGCIFIGSPQNGGIAIGLTKFWEKYPTELQVSNFTNDDYAIINVWFYSPKASPLDVSPYYDGLVATDYKKQIEGLHVTYEDFEPGFNDAIGISRSFEIMLKPTKDPYGVGIISSKDFKDFTEFVRTPTQFIADLNHIHKSEVFPFWIPDFKIIKKTPSDKELEVESHLSKLFDYYSKNIELNDWYGFWDYGDVMHTPDTYRHQWRYDVGGYAWDNSELSTDLWLWLYFLHTGRTDVFKIAEAMTKHTSEVDMYHSGRFKGFGTRHGVQHWSDSSKQLRISNVLFKRFYYYLSGGDERIGEIIDELNDSQRAMLSLDSHRKVQDHPTELPTNFAMTNIGLDWGSLIGAWMTHWERRTPNWELSKSKILKSIESLVDLPHGFANNAVLMNVETGDCKPVPPPTPEWAISHLSTVFGLNESITELIEIVKRLGNEELSSKLVKFWTDYAISFNGSPELQVQKYGFKFPKINISLQQSHARCTAHVSWLFNDSKLGEEAWKQFFHTDGYSDDKVDWKETRLQKYESVNGMDEELSFVTTNFTAQYGISAIYLLAKVGDYI